MTGAAQDRGTFLGIARTLLALALLAERAAARSLPVRFLVLVILGRAEAIARRFVAREIEPCGWGLDLSFFDESAGLRFGAAGAELLALRLRMLATILGALADADAAAAALSDGRAASWPSYDRAYGSASADGSAGRCADCPAGCAPLPKDATHLPILLVVRLPARRLIRPPDTS